MASNIRPAGVFDTQYEQDIALNRTRGDKIWVWLSFGLLLLVPLLTVEGPFGLNILGPSWTSTIINIAIFAIAVQGLNILLGYTGQISLGHAAFMGVGAYSAALLARHVGLPFWLAVPTAAVFTGLVGILFGLPSLRVKGFYLVMATLAAQFIIPWAMTYPLESLTNGTRPLELDDPTFFGLSFAPQAAMYYVIVPLSVLLFLAARNIIRSRVGRAFISIRDNDLAAELLGINVFSYKLQAFFLSALYAGIAGALFAFDTQTLSVSKFTLELSIEFLAMLVIGGAGFPLGAIFGVTFINILSHNVIPWLSNILKVQLPLLLPFVGVANIEAGLHPILFGLFIAVFLLVEPRGIAYRWEILKIAWKIRPYSY